MHYVSNHDCYLGIIVYLYAQHNTIDISISSLIVKTDATRSTHILKTRLFISFILTCLVLYFFFQVHLAKDLISILPLQFALKQ